MQIRVIKFAYLQSINESLERLGVNTLRMTGYENDNDRVQFINGKRKCTLYGVKWASLDDLNDGIINLMLLAKNPDLDVWDVRLNLKTFRLKTLERIAYEVYDWCKGEDWEDWEDYQKDLIANWLDSYN